MSRLTLAAITAVVGLLLLVGGVYEWNQTRTCGPSASAHCTAGKRQHPRRAEGMWVIGGLTVLAAAGLAVTARQGPRRTVH